MAALHLIKLCVGCDTVEELEAWEASELAAGGRVVMRTRQTPKRAGELIDGGSLYRIFRGVILCRQRILGVETIGEGANARCEVAIEPTCIRVAPTPRRAFQGWRYLQAKDAPPDLGEGGVDGEIPADLARRLREAGAW